MRLFLKFVFMKPPSIFTRNETFCERKGLLNVFGTMRLTGDLHKKIPKNRIFPPQFSVFLKVFSWKMGFLLFPVGEEWFSRLMRIPSGIFGAVKLMKCPYDTAYLVFF